MKIVKFQQEKAEALIPLDTMEWVFKCNFYSERKKVQLAVSTFVGDAAEWWEVERHCRKLMVIDLSIRGMS